MNILIVVLASFAVARSESYLDGPYCFKPYQKSEVVNNLTFLFIAKFKTEHVIHILMY